MYCPLCGAEVKSAALFCSKCGSSIALSLPKRIAWKTLAVVVLLVLVLGGGGVIWWRFSTPKAGSVRINPRDGAEMVYVPAGEFLMGAGEEELAAWLQAHSGDIREWFANELPQHTVYLDAYYLYKTEVTVAQYRKFCQATGRQMPPEPESGWQNTHPIVNVTWEDAAAYAQWAGAALPTEAQWEKAARGTDGRVYPWGNDWDGDKCQNSVGNKNAGNTAPVGSFPAGASPYGALDMAGNVWEWCADWYDAGYYKNAPTRNPTAPATGTWRVLRGGSWYCAYLVGFRAAFRSGSRPTFRHRLGFRCVLR